MPQIQAEGSQCSYDRVPDECPICHRGIEPKEVIGSPLYDETYLEIVYKCPYQTCSHLFIARCGVKQGGGAYNLETTLPVEHQPPEVPEEVSALSPDFKEIYRQASAAEDLRFDEIAGVGYRKSLEFLVKDYCIDKNPDSEEEIKKTPLGSCIDTYINDAKIKKCATLATWGNSDIAAS